MKHTSKRALAVAASIVFTSTAAFAQSPQGGTGHGAGAMMGHGMGSGMRHGGHGQGAMGLGPASMLTRQDAQSSADMGVVMDLVYNNSRIQRSVTLLPDGIRTLTESDDPSLAQSIKAHVASMSARLKDGREFNLFSTTLPVIFDNAAQIQSTVEMTAKGAIVTRKSTDPKVVAALQSHAGEVSGLVKDGRAGFHRGMQSRMAMGPGGPRSAINAERRTIPAPQSSQHDH